LDLGFFEQITAEACVEIGNRAGFTKREWRKVRPRNEQWDIAVYARALARHETANLTDAHWEKLIAERVGRPEDAQADMAALWQPDLKTLAAVAAPPPPQVKPAAPPRSGGWFERRSDWI
jgi:phage terminase large subunit GpA-like protein